MYIYIYIHTYIYLYLYLYLSLSLYIYIYTHTWRAVSQALGGGPLRARRHLPQDLGAQRREADDSGVGHDGGQRQWQWAERGHFLNPLAALDDEQVVLKPLGLQERGGERQSFDAGHADTADPSRAAGPRESHAFRSPPTGDRPPAGPRGPSGSDGRARVGDGSEDSSGDFDDDDDDSAVEDCFGSLGDDAGLDIPGCIVRTSPKQESL